jgi:hypothetical protein
LTTSILAPPNNNINHTVGAQLLRQLLALLTT